MRRAVVFGAVLAVVAGAGVQAYLKIGTDVGGTIVGIRWATQPVRYFITDRGVPGVSSGVLSDAVTEVDDRFRLSHRPDVVVDRDALGIGEGPGFGGGGIRPGLIVFGHFPRVVAAPPAAGGTVS